MTEDELFGTARNIISATLAKIHTLEWTQTLLDNPVSDVTLDLNWYGLQTVASEYFKGWPSSLVKGAIKYVIDDKVPSVFGTNYTTEQTLFNTPFYMTEEFVSVYRMHTLLPDEMILEGGKAFSLQELAFTDARKLVADPSKTTATLLQAFARTPAQTLSLKNYPKSLYNLQIGNGEMINLAEIDISRDRARGIPRYNVSIIVDWRILPHSSLSLSLSLSILILTLKCTYSLIISLVNSAAGCSETATSNPVQINRRPHFRRRRTRDAQVCLYRY